jgi:hypothetical protein
MLAFDGQRMMERTMKSASVLSCLAVAALSGTALAQFAPAISETGGLSTPFRSLPRQHQSYFHPSVLTAVTAPTTITGVQFRLDADLANNGVGSAVAWPASPLTASNFTIVIGRPSAAINTAGEIPSLTTTYAANMQNAVTVYNSSLTIPAGAFPNNGSTTTPASWGLTVNFSTPYTYNPGDGLMFYISQSGFTGSPLVFFAAGDYDPNTADAVSSLDNTSAAPVGFSSPLILNFIPTPGAVALLGLGGLLAGRRRR